MTKTGKTRFGSSSTAEEVTEGIDGSGLTASFSISASGTNGIGKETVRVLAKRGVHVFLAARNLEAAEKVKEGILKEIPQAEVDLLKLDLSSLEFVRKAVEDFLALNLPLSILVNNAGIMMVPFQLSKDGIEMQFATNYLGHFLLTYLLLDKLKRTAKESGVESRIINVTSRRHYMYEYDGGIRFEKLNDEDDMTNRSPTGSPKVTQILMAAELSRRLQEEGAKVTANSLHPGLIATNLINANNHGLYMRVKFTALILLMTPFLKSIPQGTATTAFLALNPQVNGVTGKYFNDVNEEETPSAYAKDPELAKKLWDFSIQLTNP